jgi:aminopeptidase N
MKVQMPVFKAASCVKMISLAFALFLSVNNVTAQQDKAPLSFTRADTLKGSNGPERKWWDIQKYEIDVTPNYAEKTISGSNTITFKVLDGQQDMQIDLQQPMQLTTAIWNKKQLKFTREGNVYHISFPKKLNKGAIEKIYLGYSGVPKESTVARGYFEGWSWLKDELGRPWMGLANQIIGASIWLPCKDFYADRLDNGMEMRITCADTLTAIANGRLKSKKVNGDGTATFTWAVTNPINPYCMIPSIGKYTHWGTEYNGLKGKLTCDYWVLDYNLEKGQRVFKQVDTMLQVLEFWAGPYPFYEDGYKLVESPYFGMEHQSNVAYGNKFANGYKQGDLSQSGWGLLWDYIMIHESAHEWFGNSVTCNDIADRWVNESFTTYLETLYVDYLFGVEAGNDYNIGVRKRIQNQKTIVGTYGVYKDGAQDMYMKGQAMLHMIRQITGDINFRSLLQEIQRHFYHLAVSGKQVEELISSYTKKDFSKVFDQYLRTTDVPVLLYKTNNEKLSFRWSNCVKGFNMPVKVFLWGKETAQWINPTEEWQTIELANLKDIDSNNEHIVTVLPAESSISLLQTPANAAFGFKGATSNYFGGNIALSVDRNFYIQAKEEK